MPKKTPRTVRPARLAVYVVVLAAVLALAWAVATLVSRSHPQLSPQGSHLQLLPLLPPPR